MLPLCLTLSACGPGDEARPETPTRAAMPQAIALPPMKAFSDPRPIRPERSNRDIGRDFLDLSFQLESGRHLPQFSRFEEPITLRVTGQPPLTMMADLDRLLSRLRREAGIDIHRVSQGEANITIEAVSGDQIRRHLPTAACFVVPNISRLADYRAARNRGATDWTRLRRRDRLAVFVPNDVSPQETRDCLHEELAQAIGPLNDLYRLPDSVFNDDNVHAVLTGFDMLILRAYYAPELRSGMTRAEVAARLPGILARLNPEGEDVSPRFAPETPRAWIDAIQTALGPGTSPADRRAAALEALRIAQVEGWSDHRLGFSHFSLGRLLQGSDAALAVQHFAAADDIYRRNPGMDLHRAFTAAQLAAYAITRSRGDEALIWLGSHQATAERHENATLLATLMMLRAEALDLTGRVAEAQAVRLDSLGWARYGYGADWAVRAKLQDVSALNPLKEPNG
ncbi:DUF2927 domain-containing protein [Roseovarius azorensis]